MWLKLMRHWLIGAAVTLAAPADGLAAPSPADGPARCEDDAPMREVSMERRNWDPTEPSMAEVMADPIIQAMMKSDNVSPSAVLALTGHVRRARDKRHGVKRA